MLQTVTLSFVYAAALVLRFDDNKPVSQRRELAEIFESVGGRLPVPS